MAMWKGGDVLLQQNRHWLHVSLNDVDKFIDTALVVELELHKQNAYGWK